MLKSLLLLLIVAALPLSAQQLHCGTPALSATERQFLLGRVIPLEQELAARPTATVSYVPVKLHMLRRDDGTGGLTPLQIITAMGECNRAYIASGIQFYFCGAVNEINSTRFFTDFNPDIEPLICPQNDVANVLNLYMVNGARVGSFIAGGYAYYPGGPKRLVVTYNSGGGSHVYKHEMGHIFGLPHTQQGSNDPDVTQRELVRRTNCTTTGDLICDTDSDPYDRPGATSSSCRYTGVLKDALGDSYTPPMTNTMSYWCGQVMTPGQYGRIQATRAAAFSTLGCTAVSPGAPTNLLASATVSAVTLRWTAATGPVLGYYIERATSLTDDFVTISTVGPAVTTFVDTAPPPNGAYYRVKPANAEAAFSNTVAVKLPTLALATFGAAQQGAQAQLNWATTAERDNAYFEVEVRPAGGVFNPLGRVTVPASTTQSQRTYTLADPQFLAYRADSVQYRLLGVTSAGLATTLATQTLRPKTLQLVTVTGEHRDDQATLSWTTTEEYGNAYFDIAVRPRLGTFQPLSKVASLPGNTAALHTYSLADRRLLFYNTDTAYYQITGTTTAGKATVLATKAVPVRKLEFRGLTAQFVLADNTAVLRWITNEEFGATHFEVDARPGGGSYRPVGRLGATPGIPSKPHEYELQDPAFLLYHTDSVYYRLRSFNAAGQAATLATIGMRALLSRTFTVQVAPNPFQNTVQVQIISSLAGGGELLIHNALGRILVRKSVPLLPGLTLLTIPAQPTWPAGIYFLSVQHQGASRVVKLAKEQ